MLRGENSQTDKVLSALERLQLSDGETEIAGKYLDGEAGEEILTGLTPRDMTSFFAVKYRVFQELFASCLKKKQYEMASRLLRLLYAIGAYSCCDCIGNPDFMDAVDRGYLDIDREKAVAISAQHIFLQVYRLAANYKSHLLTTRQLEQLADFADRNSEIILRAWKEFDNSQFNGRILLMVKQVKAAAVQALEFAASQLELTREQLEDKIVPSLGFDQHMERHFDYGSRSFTVVITPALEVEIYDESSRKLKNMPAPGVRDDGGEQILLKDVPPRYFSEIVWQLTRATVSSRERNENWRAKAR